MNLGQLPKPSSIELSSAQLRSVLGPIVRSGLAGTLQHPQPGRWHQSALQGTRARARGLRRVPVRHGAVFSARGVRRFFLGGKRGRWLGRVAFYGPGCVFLQKKPLKYVDIIFIQTPATSFRPQRACMMLVFFNRSAEIQLCYRHVHSSKPMTARIMQNSTD